LSGILMIVMELAVRDNYMMEILFKLIL